MKFLKGKNAARTISIMVVGLLLAAVLLVDNKSYSAYVEQRLIDAAGAFGLQVGFKHTRVYPIVFAGDAATITVPAGKWPFPTSAKHPFLPFHQPGQPPRAYYYDSRLYSTP